MRNLLDKEVNRYRDVSAEVIAFFGSIGDGTSGTFLVPSKIDGKLMRVVASSGMGWDHVSLSHAKRVPNWYEMEQVKHLFFKPDEVAMQLHVPASDHISLHPHTLHLWRPQLVAIPLPDPIMVA